MHEPTADPTAPPPQLGTRIFICAGESDTKAQKWAVKLAKDIRKGLGLQQDEVYLFYEKRAANIVEPEVQKSIHTADVMLCLIDDAYFQSPWCVYEHSRFFRTGIDRKKYCIPILTPRATGVPFRKSEEDFKGYLDERVRTVVANAKTQLKDKAAEIEAHAKTEWRDWFMKYRSIDFRTGARGQLKALIAQLKEDLPGAKRATLVPLRRLAGLSAFALAADRYHDGGWGFSVGEDFVVDEDGDPLARGRYDLSVVVLTALAAFLDTEDLSDEWKAALGAASAEQQPRLHVRDRLPTTAQLLALLERINELQPTLLRRYTTVVGELTENLAVDRWELAKRQDGARIQNYHIVLYEFLTRCIEESVAAETEFGKALVEDKVPIEPIQAQVRVLEDKVLTWLKRRRLFDEVGPLLGRRAAESGSRPERLIRKILWLLLTGSKGGLNQLRITLLENANDLRSLEILEPDAVIARRNQEQPDSSDAELMTTLLVCAHVLTELETTGEFSEFSHAAERVRRAVIQALDHDSAYDLFGKLDAIGWLTLILLTKRVAGLEVPTLQNLWKAGRHLRNARVDALSQLPVEALASGRLRELAKEHIDSTVEKHADELNLTNRAAAKEALERASFWGRQKGRQPESIASDRLQSELRDCLTGILRVRTTRRGAAVEGAATKGESQIDLESAGYNRLFLYPFSEITGMNLSSLLDIRREIGEQDSTLVEKMGAVVVTDCFVRAGDRFRLLQSSNGSAFQERTDQITARLKSADWRDERGFDDLLRVRAGKEGERWLYRTVGIEPHHGADGDTDGQLVRLTISWRFVEMPESVKDIIDWGAVKLGQLPASERP